MRWRVLGSLRKKNKKERQQELLKVLFKNRGLLDKKQRDDFLNPPHPLTFSLLDLKISSRETKKALLRIKKAILKKEGMVVYGDYDADGVCGTAILWEALNALGAHAMPYIPERASEGYGLNIETIKKLKTNPPAGGESLKLIITVDQGIVAHEKINFAQNLGIDVIVSDHHQLGRTKPRALAVIHTTVLSGAGVAWVLARELASSFKKGKRKVDQQLELAAIGTVADLLPLVGPNRSLVTFGLEKLKETRRPGLKSLYQEARIQRDNLGTYQLGFIIGPRLNATGRIGHALDSLRLLCTRDSRRANRLAQKLGRVNRERQKMMEEMALEAREAWLAQKVAGAKIIFVDGQGWEEGVIGLAASRLVDEFYLPVIVVSRGEERSKASARSIDGFNIIEAIQEADNLLVDAGGHPMAAGFTVETKNLAKLKEKLVSIAEQRIESRILEKMLKVDCEVELEDLDFFLFNQLNKLMPFGVGNPQPDFVSRGLKVVEARMVGKENKHLKLTVRSAKSAVIFSAIGFGMGEFYFKLAPEKKIDLAYSLLVDDWNREKRLQLKVKDIRV